MNVDCQQLRMIYSTLPWVAAGLILVFQHIRSKCGDRQVKRISNLMIAGLIVTLLALFIL